MKNYSKDTQVWHDHSWARVVHKYSRNVHGWRRSDADSMCAMKTKKRCTPSRCVHKMGARRSAPCLRRWRVEKERQLGGVGCDLHLVGSIKGKPSFPLHAVGAPDASSCGSFCDRWSHSKFQKSKKKVKSWGRKTIQTALATQPLRLLSPNVGPSATQLKETITWQYLPWKTLIRSTRCTWIRDFASS